MDNKKGKPSAEFTNEGYTPAPSKSGKMMETGLLKNPDAKNLCQPVPAGKKPGVNKSIISPDFKSDYKY